MEQSSDYEVELIRHTYNYLLAKHANIYRSRLKEGLKDVCQQAKLDNSELETMLREAFDQRLTNIMMEKSFGFLMITLAQATAFIHIICEEIEHGRH